MPHPFFPAAARNTFPTHLMMGEIAEHSSKVSWERPIIFPSRSAFRFYIYIQFNVLDSDTNTNMEIEALNSLFHLGSSVRE